MATPHDLVHAAEVAQTNTWLSAGAEHVLATVTPLHQHGTGNRGVPSDNTFLTYIDTLPFTSRCLSYLPTEYVDGWTGGRVDGCSHRRVSLFSPLPPKHRLVSPRLAYRGLSYPTLR